jgi:hypothetical protein
MVLPGVDGTTDSGNTAPVATNNAKRKRGSKMFEVKFTVNGIEASRFVRVASVEDAVSVIESEFPGACIVSVFGSWST